MPIMADKIQTPALRLDNHPQKQDDDATAQNGITRRTFMISLGSSAAVAISGCFFLIHDAASSQEVSVGEGSASEVPMLKEGVILRRQADGATLLSGVAQAAPTCAVNHAGAEVLRLLDGRHSIADLSRKVAATVGVPWTETLQANIAFFVAQLGICGFLRDPFYALLYENDTA